MVIIDGHQRRMEGVAGTHNTLMKALVPLSSSGMGMASTQIKHAVEPNNTHLPIIYATCQYQPIPIAT